MAAHVYWRLYITQTMNPGDYVAIAEVQMYNASGTLLSTGGSPTASSYFSSDPTYAPGKAFDNNTSTFWHSNVQPATTPQWLAYQMPSAGDVALIRMTPRGGAQVTTQSPATFKLQYSDDGSGWTDAQSYTGITWSAIWFATSFPVGTPAAGAYANWRALVVGTQNGGSPSCAELQFRETAAGADLASTTGWHGQASDVFGSFFGQNAFDDNASTYWSAVNSPPNNWVGNCLHRAVAIVEVVWQARPDGGNYVQSPSSFKLQGSNNGVTWTDVATLTPATWTSAGQSQTLAVAGAGLTGLRKHPGMEGGMRPLLSGGMNG